jgi:zinc transporter ZupT
MRLPVRSRSGNIVLAFVGSLYAVSALAILVWFVFEVWKAADPSDLVLQFALAAAAACGLWIVLRALQNLGRAGALYRSGASYDASIQR